MKTVSESTADLPLFKLSVRDLVEQTDRSGDINFRFSSRSSAIDGIRGHQRVQKSRADNYVAEKQVKRQLELRDLRLEIAGRVDVVLGVLVAQGSGNHLIGDLLDQLP